MTHFKKKVFTLFLIIGILLLVVAPTFAQSTIVVPEGTLPLDTVLESLILLIYNATYLPFASGMVVVATAFSKRLPFFKRTSSAVLSLFWTVLLWVIWIGATQIGYGGLFESIIISLTSIGATMLGITLTPMAAGKLYELSKSQNVAILGFSRKQTLSRIADEAYGNSDNPLAGATADA